MCQVPDRWRHQSEMWIIGQHRQSGLGPLARNHPVVGGPGRQHAIDIFKGIGSGGGGDSLAERHRIKPEQRRQIRHRGRIFDIEIRQEIARFRFAQPDPVKAEPQHLFTEVLRKRDRHHLDRCQRIDRPPRLRLVAQDQVFGRQARGKHLRGPLDPGVDSARIALEHCHRVRIHGGERCLGRLVDGHGPEPDIGADGGAAEHLGQSSLPGHAADLHLPQPVLRMGKPQARGDVGAGSGLDMRHPVAVARDLHLSPEPGNLHGPVGRRLRSRSPKHSRAQNHHGKGNKKKNELDKPFDDAHHWSMSLPGAGGLLYVTCNQVSRKAYL